MSGAEKADWYQQNPGFSNVTGLLQDLFGRTALGKLQYALDPTFVQQQQMIAGNHQPVTGAWAIGNEWSPEANAAASSDSFNTSLLTNPVQTAPTIPSSYSDGGYTAPSGSYSYSVPSSDSTDSSGSWSGWSSYGGY